MKVLSVAWDVFDENIQMLSNNCNGMRLVVKNICEYIGRKVESYLFIGRYVLPKIQSGNIHYVKTDYKRLVKSKGNDKEYLAYMTEIFKKTVDELKPDIINFHEYGDFAFSCIENVCKKFDYKYVVTIHLYINEKDNYTMLNEMLLINTKYMLNIAGTQFIAVSKGMRNKILNDFPNLEDNVFAIPNGTDFRSELIESDIKESLNLLGRKVLLCVGSIQDRKKQLQIVSVFKSDPQLKEKTKVLFLGKDLMNGKLQEEITENHLEESLIYLGTVSNEDMKKYYSIADGLIMPSVAEGLSLVVLEAIAYGIPVIMFSDSECAPDLNDSEVCVFAEERTDFCLAEAINKWYGKKWNKEYIKKFASYFTMERMTDDYLELYSELISN